MKIQSEKIHQKDSLLTSFLNNAAIGIVITNHEGEIISANAFLLNMFQYEASELVGKKIECLIPTKFHSIHQQHRTAYQKKSISRPMGLGMELFAVKKDETEFPVEVSLGHFFDDDEKFTVAFVTDISLRVMQANHFIGAKQDLETTVENRSKELSRALQVLELLNVKLEKNLLFQKAILDNAQVMLFLTNENGDIQFFNPMAVELTGYTEKEMVKKKFTPLQFIPKYLIEQCIKEIEPSLLLQSDKDSLENIDDFKVISSLANNKKILEKECAFKKKSGEEVPVSFSMSPIYDQKNNITGYIGAAFDITERKKSELKLRASLEKEKQLGELKSRFVSMASHEFRTPLSTILSSAYLTEKYMGNDDQQKREKHLQRIIYSVNTLTGILNEFLNVGKIEEGKINIHLSNFNIKKEIHLTIEDLQGMLKIGQHIDYNHKGSELVFLDSSLLKHIVMNLLSNAIKFSNTNASISIETAVTKKSIKLEVKDSGIGISAADQQHLTERFFRATNATNIQGTGLGLHIVSKYVELLNGKLSIKSELNKGTTISIIIKTTTHHEDHFTY
jgi:PAS domain S-box-containing protein